MSGCILFAALQTLNGHIPNFMVKMPYCIESCNTGCRMVLVTQKSERVSARKKKTVVGLMLNSSDHYTILTSDTLFD